MKSRSSLIVGLLPFVDGLLSACVLAAVLSPVRGLGLVIAFLIVPLWVELLRYFGLYGSHRVETLGLILRRILTAHLVGFIVVETALYAARSGAQASITRFAAISAVLIMLQRSVLYFGLRALRRGGFDVRHVCVLGNWQAARHMAEMFAEHTEWGMKVACVGLGRVDAREFTRFSTGEALGCSTLEAVLNQEVIDEVLIAVSPDELPHEAVTMQLCEQYGLLARILIQSASKGIHNPTVESYYGEVSISAGAHEHNESALVLKRILDILLGSLFLIAAAPLMVMCAILVKISSPGPVFFRQTRVGLHGRRFTILKFRTMVEGAERLIDAVAYRNSTKGPTFKDPRDGRVTEIGRLLRRFSMDELPQLVMVLQGDMSLVGPRPLPVRESAGVLGVQRRRFSVRPGLTCLWQVNGRSDVEFAQWMQYDLQYVDRWSLWLDAKLLAKTIPAVLSGKGAY